MVWKGSNAQLLTVSIMFAHRCLCCSIIYFFRIIIMYLSHFLGGVQLHWHCPQLTELHGDYHCAFPGTENAASRLAGASQPLQAEVLTEASPKAGKGHYWLLPSGRGLSWVILTLSSNPTPLVWWAARDSRIWRFWLRSVNLPFHSLPFADVHFLRQCRKRILSRWQ